MSNVAVMHLYFFFHISKKRAVHTGVIKRRSSCAYLPPIDLASWAAPAVTIDAPTLKVEVGPGDALSYSPANFEAPVGSNIEFHFFSAGSGVLHESSPAVRLNSACILPSSFLSRPETSNEKKASEMANIFTGVQFQYQNGFSSTQYVETRLFEPTASNATGSTQFTTIYINTGMCMFSRTTLAAPEDDKSKCLDANDSAVPPVPKNIEPTIYELEIIARLSATIADIVGRLDGFQVEIVINVDIPDFQYYWKAFNFLQKGLVDIGYVQNWIGAMDLRRNRLGTALTTMIRSAMYDRGISDSNVLIQLNSGTEQAVLLFKMHAAVGKVPTLGEVSEALTSKGPEAAKWKTFLNSLCVQDKPATMDDLGKLVHAFKTVKTALPPEKSPYAPSDHVTNNIGRNLLVQVNDVTDWRIFDKAKMFLKKCSKLPGFSTTDFTLMGVFPLQKIFLAGPGRSNLYEHRSSRGYVSEGNVFMPLSPTNIIGEVYGECFALKLQQSFVQSPCTIQTFSRNKYNKPPEPLTKWQEWPTLPSNTYNSISGLGSFLRSLLPQVKVF